jgi:hypothetical protein
METTTEQSHAKVDVSYVRKEWKEHGEGDKWRMTLSIKVKLTSNSKDNQK